MTKSKNFVFDGGAATYFGTAILSWLIIVFTLGIGYPWALCLFHRRKTKHTYVQENNLYLQVEEFHLLGYG